MPKTNWTSAASHVAKWAVSEKSVSPRRRMRRKPPAVTNPTARSIHGSAPSWEGRFAARFTV